MGGHSTCLVNLQVFSGRSKLEKFVYTIEGLNTWIGRAFGWCIMILTLSVSYEVFVRYVLNAPTVWAFDMMIQMYGALSSWLVPMLWRKTLM